MRFQKESSSYTVPAALSTQQNARRHVNSTVTNLSTFGILKTPRMSVYVDSMLNWSSSSCSCFVGARSGMNRTTTTLVARTAIPQIKRNDDGVTSSGQMEQCLVIYSLLSTKYQMFSIIITYLVLHQTIWRKFPWNSVLKRQEMQVRIQRSVLLFDTLPGVHDFLLIESSMPILWWQIKSEWNTISFKHCRGIQNNEYHLQQCLESQSEK